jgi:hypothetical protein
MDWRGRLLGWRDCRGRLHRLSSRRDAGKRDRESEYENQVCAHAHGNLRQRNASCELYAFGSPNSNLNQ